MMHYEDCVIALCDNNKKPLREFSSERNGKGRKCKVNVPFDTEYKFLIKNNSAARIKLEIDIDGSNVTGNGVIISGNMTDYLERFVDSDKKFKFVRATHENVSDPTNVENGIIKIRVSKEITFPFPHIFKQDNFWDQVYIPRRTPNSFPPDQYQPYWYSETTCYSSSVTPSLQSNHITPSVDSQLGATIEGSKSNQQFTTTSWNGDADVYWFTFQLLGREEKDPEYEKYLELKKKYES